MHVRLEHYIFLFEILNKKKKGNKFTKDIIQLLCPFVMFFSHSDNPYFIE